MELFSCGGHVMLHSVFVKPCEPQERMKQLLEERRQIIAKQRSQLFTCCLSFSIFEPAGRVRLKQGSPVASTANLVERFAEGRQVGSS